METRVSYYHVLIEMNDHISTIEQTREIEIFDIVEIRPYLHSILLPFLNEQIIELEDDNIEFKDILHLEIKQIIESRHRQYAHHHHLKVLDDLNNCHHLHES